MLKTLPRRGTLVAALALPAVLAGAIGSGAPAFAAAPPSRTPAPADGPSRAASKGCAWEKYSDVALGLTAWVSRCDYGFRKIDFLTADRSLAMRFSDGGAKPDPVIDVLDLPAARTPEDALRALYAAKTPAATASRCVLERLRERGTPKGVKRYTFVPDRTYQKELDRTARSDEVPEPPCGDLGASADGIAYFEWHGTAPKKVLYVRVGQDEPLFDEKTLRLAP